MQKKNNYYPRERKRKKPTKGKSSPDDIQRFLYLVGHRAQQFSPSLGEQPRQQDVEPVSELCALQVHQLNECVEEDAEHLGTDHRDCLNTTHQQQHSKQQRVLV